MSQHFSSTAPAATASTTPLQYLTFRLGEEEYGIDILKVQELRGYDQVTHIANAPDYVKGVLNLRGTIVTIVDLRIQFNLGTPTYDQFTVVIVLNVADRVVGIVVDGVSDVVTLSPAQIKPAPPMDTAVDASHLIGIGTLDQRMLLLMDMETLMTNQNIALPERFAG
jgi:purine-binding chemotaxis protein CheW